MKKNRLMIYIDKSASNVYNFYINPKNTPLWIESIVKEETNEWPINIGTIYKNQNKDGKWTEYVVTNLVENEEYELASKDGKYHVRYTHIPISDNASQLVYYEWVDTGELEDPFTQNILEKLKAVIEYH